MRILVAEDAEDLRDLLEFALNNHGWEVFTAKDGRDALRVYHDAITGYEVTEVDGKQTLRICDAIPFVALVLDISMPRLNGFAVGVNVRHLEKFGNIRRAIHIYITGFDDAIPPQDLLESELLGDPFVDAYIRKPFGTADLIEQIEKLVMEKCGRF